MLKAWTTRSIIDPWCAFSLLATLASQASTCSLAGVLLFVTACWVHQFWSGHSFQQDRPTLTTAAPFNWLFLHRDIFIKVTTCVCFLFWILTDYLSSSFRNWSIIFNWLWKYQLYYRLMMIWQIAQFQYWYDHEYPPWMTVKSRLARCIHHKNKFNQIIYPSLVQDDLVIYDNLS